MAKGEEMEAERKVSAQRLPGEIHLTGRGFQSSVWNAGAKSWVQ